jgi:hypothetical protein
MKSICLALGALVLLAGCSGDSYGSGTPQPTTPFEKATNGEWASECQVEGTNSFIEKLVLKPQGTGTSTMTYFQNQTCTGTIAKTEGPSAISYKTDEKAMDKARTAQVKITAKGQTADATVEVNGNLMTITFDNKTIRYTRVAPPAPPKNDGPQANQTLEFERVAVGVWTSEKCQVAQTVSYVVIIELKAGGKGSQLANVYGNGQCQGDPQPKNQSEFTYKVDRFANGGGQVTIDGKDPTDIVIQDKKMTISTEEGPQSYVKVK